MSDRWLRTFDVSDLWSKADSMTPYDFCQAMAKRISRYDSDAAEKLENLPKDCTYDDFDEIWEGFYNYADFMRIWVKTR